MKPLATAEQLEAWRVLDLAYRADPAGASVGYRRVLARAQELGVVDAHGNVLVSDPDLAEAVTE